MKHLSLYFLSYLFCVLVPVTSKGAAVVSVSSGDYHTLFLKSDGTLWGMGCNDHGQLGDGTTEEQHSPIPIQTDVKAMGAGLENSFLIVNSMYGIGENDYGQLGDYTTHDDLVQELVGNSSGSVAVAQCGGCTVFLRSDGSVWGMGYRQLLGIATGPYDTGYTAAPVQLVSSGVKAISPASYYTTFWWPTAFWMYLKTDGSVWQLNNAGVAPSRVVNDLQAVATAIAGTITAKSMFYIKSDGSLWGMGVNDCGEMGDGGTDEWSYFQSIMRSNVTAVATGEHHTLVLKSDGSLWGMGNNSSGELGDGTVTDRHVPVPIVSSNVVAIAAGIYSSFFIKRDGSLWGMGDNSRGQLGVGDTMARFVPVQILAGTPAAEYTVDPTNGPVPLTVEFSGPGYDRDGNAIIAWNWTFGDGTSSSMQSPTHTYTNNAGYAISLIVTNASLEPIVGAGPTNITAELPTVQFTATPTNGLIPFAVSFSCPSLDNGGSAIVSWNWSFGDSTSSTYQNPIHTYLAIKSKTFSPKLTATNVLGMKVVGGGPNVVATYPPVMFTATPTNGWVPMAVQFSAPSVDLLGVTITNWKWSFGDGSSNTMQNPAHLYTNTGIYWPVLNAQNLNGTAVGGLGPAISVGCVQVHTFGGAGYDSGKGGYTNMDGIHPSAGLVASGNRLYGVMSGGGNGGSGTIFAVNSDGTGFANLHHFSAIGMAWFTNIDGATPKARLALAGDTLYGACSSGGMSTSGSGTLFRISTNATCFTNLFNFASDTNGSWPTGLSVSGGMLYGAATYGGSNQSGVVFGVGMNGAGFRVIHHFSPDNWDPVQEALTNNDGACPYGAVVVLGNTLYGTTSEGGVGGGGTVFKVGTDGSGFSVLHQFSYSDGSTPKGDLLLVGTSLYGTTSTGGSGSDGTVFKVNTDGIGFATLYNFSATGYDSDTEQYTNSDGAEPSAGLLSYGGLLYGATPMGGTGGSGTIFEIGTNGAGFTCLYNFSPLSFNSDLSCNTNVEGANSEGNLAVAGTTLYATLCNGGAAGTGALFGLSLATVGPPLTIQIKSGMTVISWPSSQTGWTLEQCSDLAKADWTACGTSVSDDGTSQSTTLLPSSNMQFFRLAK